MIKRANLTPREKEIAELFAWGASKKEVATKLFISERTVENHARRIYEKTGCNKVNELSAWWFCNRFAIPMNLSPLMRNLVVIFFLSLYIYGAANQLPNHPRLRSQQVTRAARRSRRNENEFKIYAA